MVKKEVVGWWLWRQFLFISDWDTVKITHSCIQLDDVYLFVPIKMVDDYEKYSHFPMENSEWH